MTTALNQLQHVIVLTVFFFFLQFVCDGEIDPLLILFSDKVWFCLHRMVNLQKSRYWCSHNQRPVHKLSISIPYRSSTVVGVIVT